MSAVPPIVDTQEIRIRRALAAIDKLQQQLNQSERAKTEPIVIVGMACRFPGGCSSLEEYWRFLERGGDGIREIPPGRWDSAKLYDPDPNTPGTIYCRDGGYLENVDHFDADFFGISPREAQCIDPQHRLLMETSWTALEDAGISSLDGLTTGVFTGICLNDYAAYQLSSTDYTRITPYDGSGNAFCFASGRLSYFLGAQGPSLSVDTACSSSLVALHLACLSLRNQECDVAIAGAAQLHLSPQTSVFLSRSKALAPDGRCKPFDAGADGFGRGEGCGVVVLKRLSDAIASKDLIRAVIRGSAVNHDGRSSGLTVPNQIAQEKLIRQALASAKIQPSDVDYIEAHGTGTSLGDPIEMAALSTVFGENRPRPLLVGSVKSNFGHLEAASGMAGLFKVVLSLERGTIPRHLHFRTPNPHIPWADIPVEIPVENSAWPTGKGARIAGLSSFGFSGTNAHVVVEEAPASEALAQSSERAPSVLMISAKSEPALKDLAARYIDFLDTTLEDFADVCYSASIGRTVFEHRLTVEASSCSEAVAILREFVANQPARGLWVSSGEESAPKQSPKNGKRVRLPYYPFQRRSYWVGKSDIAAPLLGKRVRSAGREIVFETEIGAEHPSWMGEHRVHGKSIVPLAAFVALALDAAHKVVGSEQLALTDLTIHAAAVLPERGKLVFQTILTPEADGRLLWKIFSEKTDEQWDLHASGIASGHDDPIHLAEGGGGASIDIANYYADFVARGIEYGPSFRLIETLHRNGSTSSAHVAAPPDIPSGSLLHPVQLDACFQSLAAAFPSLAKGETFLPVAVKRLRLYRSHAGEMHCDARAIVTEGNLLSGELVVRSVNDDPVASVEGFTSRTASVTPTLCPPLYIPVWTPQANRGTATPLSEWIILADDGGTGAELQGLLQRRGDRCSLIRRGTQIQDLDLANTNVIHLWSLDADADHAELCGSVLSLASVLGNDARLWLITRGGQPLGEDSFLPDPRQAPIWGLGRTLANERPELRCVCIDLEPDAGHREIEAVFGELTNPDDEDQVAFRTGLRHVARLTHRRDTSVASTELRRVTIAKAGTIADLKLIPVKRMRPSVGQVEIEVRAAGLNFKDVLYALNMVPFDGEAPIGFECSGVVTEIGPGVEGLRAGDSVVSVLSPGSIGNYLLADARFTVRIPEGINFTEAATLPIAFLTASLALKELRKGETVLIHTAAGGVGQAAVQIAQRVGARIFATASHAKHDFLRAQGIEQVFDSRSLSFADRILELTNGEGVDVVLNSLKDEFVSASLRTLKLGGRFVEIGALGNWDASKVQRVRPDIAYHALQLGEVADCEPERIAWTLTEILHDTANGKLRPLKHEVFSMEQTQDAFRRMAQGKHTGKLVISVKDTGGAYLITGGYGALGLQIAQWLAKQGASMLHLVGRSKPSDASAIREIEALGARVIVHSCDVSDTSAVARLFQEIASDRLALRGVIHAAAVLRDGILSSQSWEEITPVFAAKVDGAWNLHQHTRDLSLDFFICFSSFAGLYGSPGQGAYAAANCYLDALMHYRRRKGLPGLSINWGSWAGEGMAQTSQQRSMSNGVRPLSPERGLAAFGSLLTVGDAQVCAIDADWSLMTSRLGRIPSMLRAFAPQGVRKAEAQLDSIESHLRNAPAAQRRSVLLGYLRSQLAAVLNLDAPQSINPRKGFFDYGLDSLMAVELRNRLQSGLSTTLPATLLFDQPHLEALADYLLQEKFSDLAFSPNSAVEDVNADDVVALLARELESLEAERTHG